MGVESIARRSVSRRTRRWFFFFSSRRRHTRFDCDWSSDVCSSDLTRQLFSVLPELLVTDTHVNERVSAAEKEAERLRRELEDLKRENHQLRGERDEIAQAMTVVAQRLGFTPRKSPFERTHAGDHTKPGELAQPGEPARPREL